jgi:hypothetical protein
VGGRGWSLDCWELDDPFNNIPGDRERIHTVITKNSKEENRIFWVVVPTLHTLF